jgi:hypothetical protein
VDAVGRGKFFIVLINVFGFGILQTSCGCIQLLAGALLPLAPPLVTGLDRRIDH